MDEGLALSVSAVGELPPDLSHFLKHGAMMRSLGLFRQAFALLGKLAILRGRFHAGTNGPAGKLVPIAEPAFFWNRFASESWFNLIRSNFRAQTMGVVCSSVSPMSGSLPLSSLAACSW